MRISDWSSDVCSSDLAAPVRARAGAALNTIAGVQWHCQQSFKPFADALIAARHVLEGNDQTRYPLVLVLPPRQRDEARATLARAFMRLRPGGVVLAADRKSTRLNSSHYSASRMASSACKKKQIQYTL